MPCERAACAGSATLDARGGVTPRALHRYETAPDPRARRPGQSRPVELEFAIRNGVSRLTRHTHWNAARLALLGVLTPAMREG